jgi:hypothetical protein
MLARVGRRTAEGRMRLLSTRPALWVILLLMFATARAAEPTAASPRVLFVGNSYTFVNNLPAVFSAVGRYAHPQAPAPETDMVVAPGATLADLVDGYRYEALLERGHFDYVVLQERGGILACLTTGQRPLPTECAVSVDAHRRMAKMAKAAGAKVVIFGTWPMRPGEQGPVSRGTRQVASRLHLPFVDVGAALQRARVADKSLRLFLPDDHPDHHGTLLAAMMLWQAITGERLQAGAFEARVPEFTGLRKLRVKPGAKPEPPAREFTLAASAEQMASLLAAIDRR